MSAGFFVALDGSERSASASARSDGAPVVLPCLSSNNCITEDGHNGDSKPENAAQVIEAEEPRKAWQILGGGHKRMAFVLAEEMIVLGHLFGVERLGFLTLTFAENVQKISEAQRRFHSLNTNVIRLRYERAIGVWERQKSGRVHFHLVVVLASDIRTGFDFEALGRQDYRSANESLRAEWAFWRKTAPAYGFGRTELLPVRSNAEGIARYVGKYVSKHIRQREERDKGARVVRFFGYGPGDRKLSARFGWNTERGWLWRQKVAAWCEARGIGDLVELRERVGPRWAWRLKEEILATRIDGVFPSREAVDHASLMEGVSLVARHEAREILEGMQFVKTYLLKPHGNGNGEIIAV